MDSVRAEFDGRGDASVVRLDPSTARIESTHSMPRILHLIESIGRGGAETCLLAGLPALRSLGWDVCVAPLGPPYDLQPELEAVGVPVVRGGHGSRAARVVSWARLRPALIHTHLFRANVIGRALALALRVPVVTSLHNPDYGAEGPGWMRLRIGLDRLTTYATRPTFIAVSAAVADDYRAHIGIASMVVPNPIDAVWFRTQPSRAEARRELGIRSNERCVFTAGRLHPQKGFDVLARAAATLPGVRFAVAGEGPERARLEASGALQLLGVVPRAQIQRWIAAADVVVAPSRYEAFGVFAAEALASERAMIASDIPGLRDTVGDAALLVPPDDPRALANALRQVMADDGLRGHLERRGPIRASRFAAQGWAARLDAIYRGCGITNLHRFT